MDQILKKVKKLYNKGFYKHYAIRITDFLIEVKLTPKDNEEKEINWMVENDKQGKSKLLYYLEIHYEKLQ